MKIDRIETFVVRQELASDECFAYSQNWYSDRTVLLCRVTTDDGIEGWGEAFGPALVHKTTIDSVYTPLVIGRDPFDTEVIWEELYNRLRDHGQKGLSIEAMSAIDIALWDIKGKATGLPLWRLLGGAHRDYVVPYATGLYRRRDGDVSALAKEAESYAKAGFRAIKLKIGFGLAYDRAAVRAVREAIGDGIELMVDANHAYGAATASRIAREIEGYDIRWFEEPVPPEDLAGYAEVRSRTTIPIAGGEAEFTRYGFERLLRERTVDIVQPDCCVIGGISEFRKIVTLSTIHNVQCLPHIWGSAVAYRTGLHCAFSLPHFPPSLYPQDVYLETDRTTNIFREKLSRTPVSIRDGKIGLPTEPGLGVDVDEDLVMRYRIA